MSWKNVELREATQLERHHHHGSHFPGVLSSVHSCVWKNFAQFLLDVKIWTLFPRAPRIRQGYSSHAMPDSTVDACSASAPGCFWTVCPHFLCEGYSGLEVDSSPALPRSADWRSVQRRCFRGLSRGGRTWKLDITSTSVLQLDKGRNERQHRPQKDGRKANHTPGRPNPPILVPVPVFLKSSGGGLLSSNRKKHAAACCLLFRTLDFGHKQMGHHHIKGVDGWGPSSTALGIVSTFPSADDPQCVAEMRCTKWLGQSAEAPALRRRSTVLTFGRRS